MLEARDQPDAAGMEIISKSSALLEVLAQHGAMSTTRIAEMISEPASSTYRLISSLESIGWVERESPRGSIRLGLAFVRLGHRLEAQLDVRHLALPELRDLVAVTRQTAFLCIRRADRAVCVERIDGQDVQVQRLRLGESLPLSEGAAPRAILAFERRDIRDDFLDGLPARERSELRSALETIQEEGISTARMDGVVGIGAVGSPIFDQRGRVVAAISISGLTDKVFGSNYDPVDLVRKAAARISENLGARVGVA